MRIQRLNITDKKNENLIDEKVDLTLIETVIEKYKNKKGSLIPILQEVQSIYGYIPRDVIKKIAEKTEYSSSEMYGVATFYAQFRLSPVGKYIIKVCDGTACHVKGSKNLISRIHNKLNLNDKIHTTEDMIFTLETVSCLGACGLAPVIVINENVHGQVSENQCNKIISQIIDLEKKSTIENN